MTETTGASAGARRSSGKKGVRVERIFTTPGVHPYDEVTWEHRDVVQQNWKTGVTIFEQRDVESRTSGRSTPPRSSPPSTSAAPSAPPSVRRGSSSSSTASC